MEALPGRLKDSVRYTYGGFTYHRDKRCPTIFRCSSRSSSQCRGMATICDKNIVTIRRAHNHSHKEHVAKACSMRQEMMSMCRNTQHSLKYIFDTVCLRYPEVAAGLTFTSVRTSMTRERAKSKPPLPNTLADLGATLNAYQPTRHIYRGIVKAADGSTALVFAEETLLDALNETPEIYVDGTFKVVPNRPNAAQLYTVHIRKMDTGIPVVYALCSSRTKALYASILQRLKQLAPNLERNLQFVMGDYERAAMTALNEHFPTAKLHGCWFHYNQAVLRRWKKLGLSNAPQDILSMAMALPLVPPDSFQPGLRIMAEIADEIAKDYPSMLEFIRYMRTQWSPLAKVVSVHDSPVKTNDLLESSHNEAFRKLGGLHVNIWTFLDKLINIISDQKSNLMRLQGGQSVQRPCILRKMANDNRIRQAQCSLANGRLTLREFLRTAGYATERFRQINVEIPVPEDPEDVEEEVVDPSIMVGGHPDSTALGVLKDTDSPGRVRGRGHRIHGQSVKRKRRHGGNHVYGDSNGGQSGVVEKAELNESTPIVITSNHETTVNNCSDVTKSVACPDVKSDPFDNELDEARSVSGPVSDARPDDSFHPRFSELYQDEEICDVSEDGYSQHSPERTVIPFHDVVPSTEADDTDSHSDSSIAQSYITCCVCLDALALYTFLPCGHKCCCANCTINLESNQCPYCDENFEFKMIIRTP